MQPTLLAMAQPFWSAPAERSGDCALAVVNADRRACDSNEVQSAVAASLCRRTPQDQNAVRDLGSSIGYYPIKTKGYGKKQRSRVHAAACDWRNYI